MRELTIPALIKNIDTVTEFVNSELEKYNCPQKARVQINVAIDELFGNIAHYAYSHHEGNATVQVTFEKDPRAVVITFIDKGIPYNPLQKEDRMQRKATALIHHPAEKCRRVPRIVPRGRLRPCYSS